jgi:hypothetical protein
MVNLEQQVHENQFPFCSFDPAAMFQAIEFTYPVLVSHSD